MRSPLTTVLVTSLLVAATALASGSVSPSVGATLAHGRGLSVDRVSTDPYRGDGGEHATEAEPDTFAWGTTVVSVFQVGRFSDGGATDTGWATSSNNGKKWSHGDLPGITTPEGGTWARVSDPVIAYDAQDKVWLASGLVLDASVDGRGVVVNSSKDGIHWNKPVLAAGNNSKSYDKDWITCDNTTNSPHFGNCYVEVDLTSSGDSVVMVTSTDGGKTWGPEKMPSGGATGLGGQPLVQPDGTVVVPYTADFSAIEAFRSTDGGSSWTAPVLVSNTTDHDAVGMREEPLPSAEMDAKGKLYVAWDDCRFRKGCSSNDIVMSTSPDGKTWSKVVRIPIDSVTSGRDHFDPGIGVSPTLSGSKVKLGLYYYFYPKAACTETTCKLEVGYVSSTDAGTTWSKPITLAGPMTLGWLAQAGGAMVGDYIGVSVIGNTAVSVFAVGFKPTGALKNQAMYSAGPLKITGGSRPALHRGVVALRGAPAARHPLPLR